MLLYYRLIFRQLQATEQAFRRDKTVEQLWQYIWDFTVNSYFYSNDSNLLL